MSTPTFTSADIERLAKPIEWSDFTHESPITTRNKIERAKQLNVIAVLFTGAQVTQRIHELATLEHARANGEINERVYAVLLRGGNQFAVPFFSHMATLSPNMDPSVDYLHASRYGKNQNGKALRIYRPLGPDTDLAGKKMTLIEDTIDEGITIDRVSMFARDAERVKRFGKHISGTASDVSVISLTDKRIANLTQFTDDQVTRGFYIPNAWAGGMGLDGPNEANRWIPELVLTSVQDEKYRESMPEILDALGDRAIMGMDDIDWIKKPTK
jgi:hypoxanthine-guanine phosphoribosyltransferase